ncbi:ABC transporter ATP-binding protein [Brucella pituitosa]|uniref:ABC transporter ATP-binding protein n=1 Tax=Brucella pituitosa TaxID=571256 RepID=UPI000C26F306|nr:ABC transporter ATP-binding protein [Brucella pituitosa]PQZ48204.1 Fe3+/spermidine/putrescine ABC transporter ATP-binding protein [Ochrobactrum sp. MYb19]PRA54468.1 Fe3+/spermidine/putrescine ABC transporter ATP-binding protein [Ochrobactrum sp. MYb68]PRA64390.1 Fe3+/spermidine/putrescine ABC transporter ATP-binding protein [Ochrobactrum sp. MYb18]PRA75100.1 Fe3+/spermidine/putrescine ABC transporter ATP-binding protein [Brucella thiophenivorans]PRA85477.1 Fe3+/spermidine/putrescine ABC tra
MSFLTLSDISRYYGKFAAVDNFNLQIEKGEFISLLGPSGCGKTTTLQMIAGLVPPSSGAITLDGRDITRLAPAKRELGVVFQSYALFPHMTVAQNVSFGLEMRKVPKAEREKRVRDVLELVRLSALAERYPREMSGGQRQRVAIARALVINPPVLLLDEPLSNLDAQLREEMQFELRRIQRTVGITTIMVTHDQAEALSISDRIVVMEKGLITQVDAPYKLYEHPHNHFISNFVGKSNFLKAQADGEHITLADTQIRFPAKDASASGEVSVFIRPEKVHLVDADEGHVSGEVTTRYFMGAQWLLGVLTPAGMLSVALPNLGNPPPIEGSKVGLKWNHEDCRILNKGAH